MLMHQLICGGVIAVFVGCGGARHPAAPGSGSTEPAQSLVICPDGSTDCTQSNGAGVYTAEDGQVGMGQFQLMITHFINSNSGPGVTFQGRYFDGQSEAGAHAQAYDPEARRRLRELSEGLVGLGP